MFRSWLIKVNVKSCQNNGVSQTKNGLTIASLDVHLKTSKQLFLSGDAYESEINEKNPIGNRGDLARAYGDLMKQMWCGNSSTVAPRHFKVCILDTLKNTLLMTPLFPQSVLGRCTYDSSFPSVCAGTLYL